jgi:hypothetical protein
MTSHSRIPEPDQTRRRRLLGLAARSAALLGGAAVTIDQGSATHAQDQAPIVGSWLVTATPAGGQPGGPPRLLVSFMGDGVALRTAPLQQAAPPPLGVPKMFISTTHGTWGQSDDGRFGLTFVGFAFDDTGAFLATQRIRVAVQVDDSGGSFSGPYQTDFLADDGTVKASSSGTVQGTRIQMQLPA